MPERVKAWGVEVVRLDIKDVVLANTAKLLEANPVLLRLRELEAIKDIAENIPNLSVFVGAEELTKRLGFDHKALTKGE